MSDISKFQVKSVVYNAKDTQARETAEEALQKAETNENSITALNTSVETAIADSTASLEKAETALSTAETAKDTAEKAQASADEKLPFLPKAGIGLLIGEEEEKTFTDLEMSQILGVDFLTLKNGDTFIVLSGFTIYDNSQLNLINLYTWNGTTWEKESDYNSDVIDFDASGHFQVTNSSANNARTLNILCIPVK